MTILEMLKNFGPILAVAGIFGWVFKLIQSNSKLKNDVAEKDAEAAIGKTLNELGEADKDAKAKEDAFNAARDAYNKSNGSGGVSGPT